MQEDLVTFPAGEVTLAGNVARPDGTGPFPAVLLVVGSGPIDRNSDLKKLPLGITRSLADTLADHGFASLRYDKRGVGASGGGYQSTGFDDNADDAAAALEFLRQQPGVDPNRVFVVGHSEGALIAIRLAGSAPTAGVVLLAGAAQTGEAVLRWQGRQVAEHLPGAVRGITRLLRFDPTRSQLKQLEKIKRSSDDVMRVQGVVKLNAKWFREFMAFDPATAFARARVPILAITGSDDVQVDPADVEMMGRLTDAPYEGHVVEGVNHILRTGGASPRSYRKQVTLPVDPRVLDLITGWLERQMASTDLSSWPPQGDLGQRD